MFFLSDQLASSFSSGNILPMIKIKNWQILWHNMIVINFTVDHATKIVSLPWLRTSNKKSQDW